MFQNCIRCTICVENCPVFGVNPLFPGPKQAGPDAQRFRLDGETATDEWVKYCSQCRRCETACPYGVDIAEIILRAQIRNAAGRKRAFAQILFAHNYLAGKAASWTAPVFNRLAATEWAGKMAGRLGISGYLPFPKFKFFSLRGGLPPALRLIDRGKKRVAFFHGCFLKYNRPDIGRTIKTLMQAAEMDVAVPRQFCCGLPALGNGNLKAARMYAQRNVDILSAYVDAGFDIVYSCTSCGLTLTGDYPGILGLKGGRKIAENSYHVYEYILNLVESGVIDPAFGEVSRKIVYFVSCHLRAIGIGYPAARLLSKVPGIECEIMDDRCCGLSGTYGFKKANENTARSIGEKAAQAVMRTGAEAIVADCGACRMQLGHLTGLPVLDPAEILTESLKRSGILPLKRPGLIFR